MSTNSIDMFGPCDGSSGHGSVRSDRVLVSMISQITRELRCWFCVKTSWFEWLRMHLRI
jgi:hypothetical protein